MKPLESFDFSQLFGPAPAVMPEPDAFGRIGAGDPGWETAREAWLGGAPLRDLFGETLFDLNGTVGAGRQNQRGDVFKLQSLMHREGHLDAAATGGPTGYWGNRDDAALRDLQKENALTIDGWAAPGGETIGRLRDLYRPPQGLQVPEAEMRAREATLGVGRDLAAQLGLDPDDLDLANPAVLPALGGVNFIRYLQGRDREAALQKVQDLRATDPKLAGRLQALAGEIVSQPQWHYDKMTPEELERVRKTLRDDAAAVESWGAVLRPIVRPLLPKATREIEKRLLRPAHRFLVRDEDRRLGEELERRRRDPRDR